MKSKYYIPLLLLGIASNMFSQNNRVNYTYDAAGNRLSGLSSQLRMATISDREAEDEIDTPEIYSDKIEQSNIRIYPNPTKGILRVEIIRLAEENPIHIQLYDMSGKVLINEPNAAPFTDLNISDQPAGTYILTIFSDNSTTQWKIIKE